MTEAIQSDRNSGSPSGAQGETEFFAAIGATTGMLIISAILLSSGAPGVPARPPRCRTLRLRSGRLARRPFLHEQRTTSDSRLTTHSQTATPAAATTAHNKRQSPPPESPPRT